MTLPVTLHVSFLMLSTFNTLWVAWKSYETRSGQRLVGICYVKGHCSFEESCLSLQHRGSKVMLLTVCSFMLCRTDCCPPVMVHFKLSGEGLTYHIYSLNYYKVSTSVLSHWGTLEQGVQSCSCRASDLQSLAPTCPNKFSWKFLVVLKAVISSFRCLIRIWAKLYRIEAFQELDCTPLL